MASPRNRSDPHLLRGNAARATVAIRRETGHITSVQVPFQTTAVNEKVDAAAFPLNVSKSLSERHVSMGFHPSPYYQIS
jgi:hypothetical protein